MRHRSAGTPFEFSVITGAMSAQQHLVWLQTDVPTKLDTLTLWGVAS